MNRLSPATFCSWAQNPDRVFAVFRRETIRTLTTHNPTSTMVKVRELLPSHWGNVDAIQQLLARLLAASNLASMAFEPVILDSAHRPGVSDAAMLHALRFPIRHFVREDSMTKFIGPEETGTLVEVGVVEWHGVTAIAHAMRPARSKYLR